MSAWQHSVRELRKQGFKVCTSTPTFIILYKGESPNVQYVIIRRDDGSVHSSFVECSVT